MYKAISSSAGISLCCSGKVAENIVQPGWLDFLELEENTLSSIAALKSALYQQKQSLSCCLMAICTHRCASSTQNTCTEHIHTMCTQHIAKMVGNTETRREETGGMVPKKDASKKAISSVLAMDHPDTTSL